VDTWPSYVTYMHAYTEKEGSGRERSEGGGACVQGLQH
jgi:hypothetical protein